MLGARLRLARDNSLTVGSYRLKDAVVVAAA